MISSCANSSISGIGKLGDECCYSNEQSYSQKTLNLIFFSIRKKRMAGGIRSVLTDMVVIIFISLLILLAITNIVL